MKAAGILLAAVLAGCGGGGGGGDGEEAHMAGLVVRNVDDLNEITSLWYKSCLSRWNHDTDQLDYYVGQSGDWIPIALPWWEAPPGSPIPSGPMLWPGEEVFVGEVPEGHYSFVWCQELAGASNCPGCEILCPNGFSTTFCQPVLNVAGEAIVEITP